MIEKIWFHQHFLGKLLWPILKPLSFLFQKISTKRRENYQHGLKDVFRPNIPVIIVGNITVGGNGKTPMVVWLVEQLISLGYHPGVVSRGYGGKASYPYHVNAATNPEESGDEPLLIYQRTGVPVVVDPNRVQAVKSLILSYPVDFIISDDGLQHYALARDIEFIIVDGKRRFGNQALLPLGPLREPISRLTEVDFIINNGGDVRNLEISMRLAPQKAVNLLTQEKIDLLELKQLVAFAGIGHPPRFFNMLENLGADLIATRSFADHKAFDQSLLMQFVSQGQNVLMTEKDAVKCRAFAQENWWYLPVSAQIDMNATQKILDKINEVKLKYGSPLN